LTQPGKASLTHELLSKVPAVTLGFWIIKILCTTLGETGGDTVSMTWLGENTEKAGESGVNGYLAGTAIFGVLLVVLVFLQIRAKRFIPWLYWATIIASTTAGTTLADFTTRSLGIGYWGGSLLLLGLVLASLFTWKRVLGSVDVNSITGPRQEIFYWITITFSQTLGTALGDWAAEDRSGTALRDWMAGGGLGYAGGAMAFGAALAVLAGLFYFTRISRVALFWMAFILTRPLGATVGDFFDKPHAQGGLEISRPIASAVLAVFIVGAILLLPQRAGVHPGKKAEAA
jgi:uncharacterized membrane-anchored protein